MIKLSTTKNQNKILSKIQRRWVRFWMKFAGLTFWGRISTRFATWFSLPHKASVYLASLNPIGYIAPTATVYHSNFQVEGNILISDRVTIYQAKNGGEIILGKNVTILRESVLETGHGGYIKIGATTCIHPRCQVNAYVAGIEIGSGCDIAPNCAFYSYNHGVDKHKPIREQALSSKGKIKIDDDVWLGVGVTVLSGVHIGKGAVIGAGSMVIDNIPENAIAVGRPAKVIRIR